MPRISFAAVVLEPLRAASGIFEDEGAAIVEGDFFGLSGYLLFVWEDMRYYLNKRGVDRMESAFEHEDLAKAKGGAKLRPISDSLQRPGGAPGR